MIRGRPGSAPPFLTVDVPVIGKRGLLGVALDPDFATNDYLYVYYVTAGVPIHNRVSRFTAAGDMAVPGSEVVLLDLPPIDPGGNRAQRRRAQVRARRQAVHRRRATTTARPRPRTLDSPFGKILRINKDGSIPADNPFYGQAPAASARRSGRSGLRNPYTFAFKPGTGRLSHQRRGRADLGRGERRGPPAATTAGRTSRAAAATGVTATRSTPTTTATSSARAAR